MNLVITVVAFLVALAILIVVHELGHYLVARACGVKVLRFSIGFGRPLWRRTVGPDQTEWVLAAIPFGGYVAMLDERELRANQSISESDLPRAFNRQSVAKRAAIVAAGPFANFLLAIVLYTGLGMVGVNEPRALLGVPPAGTLAANAGLAADRDLPAGSAIGEVKAVNGEPVRSMVDLRWRMLQIGVGKGSANLELADATGRTRQFELDLSGVPAADIDGDFIRRIGLVPALPQRVVGDITPGSAAARAGLVPGDIIRRVDGVAVTSAEQVVNAIRARPGQNVQLEVDRNGLALTVGVLTERQGEGAGATGRIGAAIRTVFPMAVVRYGPIDAGVRAVSQTWETSVLTLRMIGKMIMGEVSLKTISGPVTIADYAGQSARIGMAMYLTFIAFISISIGLMNLLPIPMLDGGHLLYYLVEVVMGRAPSERVIEWAQRAGFAVLAGLMLVALFNDFTRLFS